MKIVFRLRPKALEPCAFWTCHKPFSTKNALCVFWTRRKPFSTKNAIADYFESEKEVIQSEGNYVKTTEKSRGRYEQRECYITTDIARLCGQTEWQSLAGIGMIVSKRRKADSETVEKAVHYVIYSKGNMTAIEILDAKRQHWSIENRLHWTLDVIFGEDNCRMRLGNCAENVNVLRHLAINLIRSEKLPRAT